MEIIVEIWVGTKIYSIEAATMIRMKNKRKVCWLTIYIYMYFQDNNTTKTISIKSNKESWQLYSVIQSKLPTDINRTVGTIFNELAIQCSYSLIQLLIPSSWRHRKTRNVNFWYIWCLFLLEDPYIYINWLFVVQVLPYQ